MDFDNESLLRCFKSEEQEEEIKAWCLENGHKRSDIFEYRLEKGDKLREEGNEFFKEGDYDTALERYMAAVYQLDFDVGQQWNLMEKHHYELNTRKLKVISNICAAYLKARDWTYTKLAADIGLRHLDKAKLTDPDAEAKFLYRKGLANLERGFSEDAHQDLKKCAAIKPNDREVRQALKQASGTQKADREKAKEVWKSTLLTEEEKELLGPWWHRAVLWKNCTERCSACLSCRCCRRKRKSA